MMTDAEMIGTPVVWPNPNRLSVKRWRENDYEFGWVPWAELAVHTMDGRVLPYNSADAIVVDGWLVD